MARQKKPPELTLQQHIADYLVRVHGYGVLTQADTLTKLTEAYSTDARDEVFKALRKELAHTPLWLLLRHGLKVRGLELRLFYPKPRSAESAAATKHRENCIVFRPHFYFGVTNQEIDFVIFLNGLPIVALELKHEKNQNVHDAVAQFVFVKYREGTPFEPEEPGQELCPKRQAEILAVGVFTQKDAVELTKLLATGTDAQVQYSVGALRSRFQARLTTLEERKTFVYLLARFVRCFTFFPAFSPMRRRSANSPFLPNMSDHS